MFDKDGISFLVDRTLLQACGEIKVDFVDDGFRSGFSIYSARPVGGGSGCSGCGSSCG